MVAITLGAAALAALSGCAGAPQSEPPTPAALPAAIEPCSLITLDALQQATGTSYGAGQPEVFHGPPAGSGMALGSAGSGCDFSPASPTPVTTSVSVPDGEVRITLVTPAQFEHVRGGFGGTAVSSHPISLRGAEAVELVGPDLGTVYARRGTLVFAVDVSRGKGEDTAAEERIATIVLFHR